MVWAVSCAEQAAPGVSRCISMSTWALPTLPHVAIPSSSCSRLLMTTAVSEGSTTRSQELCHCDQVLTKINWSAVWEVATLLSACSPWQVRHLWLVPAMSNLVPPDVSCESSSRDGCQAGQASSLPATACTGCYWQQEPPTVVGR